MRDDGLGATNVTGQNHGGRFPGKWFPAGRLGGIHHTESSIVLRRTFLAPAAVARGYGGERTPPFYRSSCPVPASAAVARCNGGGWPLASPPATAGPPAVGGPGRPTSRRPAVPVSLRWP